MRRLALAATFSLIAVSADALGNRTELTCSALVESKLVDSSIKVICGWSAEQVNDNLRLALSGREGMEAVIARLETLTPAGARLTAQSIASFFSILQRDEVEPDQLRDRLAEIAQRHLELEEQLRRFRVNDPEIQRLIDLAGKKLAVTPPDHAAARDALAEARAMRRERREAAEKILNEQRRDEAGIARRQAELEASLLNRLEAARLYQEAEALLPEQDRDARWKDLHEAAKLLDHHGDFRADNAALEAAIGVWSRMLYLVRPDAETERWALTQGFLADSLVTLGGRERGTGRLDDAVAAYRAALDVHSRDRSPLDWAWLQDGLGSALHAAGQRQKGNELLEQAVSAHRAALTEFSRSEVPLDWARTQNNLGYALTTLGRRQTDTGRTEEAVSAYRAALEELSPAREPFEWSAVQVNLGSALLMLGYRETGTARLEEAETAFLAALGIWTQDREPYYWAITQMKLGEALRVLGERQETNDRLEQSAAAFSAALEEIRQEDAPLQWAQMQSSLGVVLRVLGEREASTARLKAGVVAQQAALEEYTRARVPHYWAETQMALGIVLGALGRLEPGTERLQEALTAYRAALEETSRSRAPLDWALIRANMMLVHRDLFDKTGDAKELDLAQAAIKDARAVFEEAQAHYYSRWIENAQFEIDARRAD